MNWYKKHRYILKEADMGKDTPIPFIHPCEMTRSASEKVYHFLERYLLKISNTPSGSGSMQGSEAMQLKWQRAKAMGIFGEIVYESGPGITPEEAEKTAKDLLIIVETRKSVPSVDEICSIISAAMKTK